MKLTDRSIPRKPTNGAAEQILFDDRVTGFGIRLRADGQHRWVFQWHPPGLTKRITIGKYPAMREVVARKKAKDIERLIAEGINPHQENTDKRKDAALTFLKVAADYVAMKQLDPNIRPKTVTDTKRYLLGTGEKYFRSIYSVPISTISRAQIADAINLIVRQNGPIAAVRARSVLSAMMTWALQCGLINATPMIGVIKPKGNPPRDRVLTDAELAAIWKALDEFDYGRIIRLLILTGARREEIAGMMWSEIDFAANTWTLPASRAKNKRALTLPLSKLAMSIIQSVPRRLHRESVFGDRSDKGFSSWGRGKADLDAKLGDAVKEPFVLHDIRRSVATGMNDIMIPPYVVETILNHLGHKQGVSGVYNWSVRPAEVRDAMMKWSAHVEGLVGGKPRQVVNKSKKVPVVI